MRQGVAIFAAAAVVAGSLPFIRQHDGTLLGLLHKAQIAVTGPAGSSSATQLEPPPLSGIELQYLDDRRDVVVAPAHGKRTAELTVDPVYQRAALSILRRGRVHEGALVMTDVRTGKVLVWASHNVGRPRDVPSEAKLPAASIFKLVTSAALVEAGVPLDDKTCYSGGAHGVLERDLEPDDRRDRYCATLAMAIGRSLNVVVAREAVAHLDPAKLTGAAHRLGWGLDIPFDVPIEQSTVDIPADDRLEFARAAAGFWHTTLSPFQAANLVQTIANDGEMIRSFVVERVLDADEHEIYRRPHERQVFKRVLDTRTAWAMTRMMEQTVRNGTAFKAFHDRAGRPFLPDIAVASKTGTLAKKEHGGETLVTWWVGFAPADKPQVAISALVTNRGPWTIKATHLGVAMMRIYFADRGNKGVHYPPSFRGLERRKKKQPPATKHEDVGTADKGEPS